MKLDKQERKKLIARISKASGVAQYALEAKMTDEEAIKVANNLEILLLVKPANNYNRYCQAQKTAEANAKLKQFLDVSNSEILKAGQWLLNSLSKSGQARKRSLLEKDLVHKDDYNQAVTDYQDTIETQREGIVKIKDNASGIIESLEKRIDSLQTQLQFFKNYIVNNYGQKEWENIIKYMPDNFKDDEIA